MWVILLTAELGHTWSGSELCAKSDSFPSIPVKAAPRSAAPRVIGNQATLSPGHLGHVGAVLHSPSGS